MKSAKFHPNLNLQVVSCPSFWEKFNDFLSQKKEKLEVYR